MAWIKQLEAADAEGKLKEIYERFGGELDNILKIHSLNPLSLEHHYRMYAHLMRGHSRLSRAEREMIAVVVSRTNDCFY